MADTTTALPTASVGTITFEEVVAGIDLTPHCEIKSCRCGKPVATHIRLTILECHRYEHFMCPSCAERQVKALEKWNGTLREQRWRCTKCGHRTLAPLPSIIEVRPL